MDSDRQLHAQIVGALDPVTPPAPWLASSVRGALSSRRPAAKPPWSLRGLAVAVPMRLIYLLRLALANPEPPGDPNLMPLGSARDEFVRVEAYVVFESSRAQPVRDASSTAYLAMVGRDYDHLGPITTLQALNTCAENGPFTACLAPEATAREAAAAFLADLKATAPPAGLAEMHRVLVGSLEAELRFLDVLEV